MENFTNKSNLGNKEMSRKLQDMRDEQDKIIEQAKELQIRYEQLDEDIDLLNMMIMYQSNKDAREKENRKKFNFK